MITDNKISYEDIFQRNLGMFTKEEQERIRNLKVAIAGGGGLGGTAAYILAKLGVGEIRIADPEEFETSNINRQFGAYVDTIGQNKAEVIAQELLRINPFLKVVVVPEALDETNIPAFLQGVDVVIDGIEFFELNAVLALHREATTNGIPIFTAQAAMEISTYTSFLPHSEKFEDLITTDGKLDIRKAIALCFPVLPKSLTDSDVENIILGSMHVSSNMIAPEMGVSILCQDLIGTLIQGREPFAVAPDMLVLNIEAMDLYIHKIR